MKVINLFGGPGTGKSTLAAAIFVEMKIRGYNVELVTEYAKTAVYENRAKTLKVQPYVFGKQLNYLERVAEQVEWAITDSPIILSSVYDKFYGPNYPESFHVSCIEIFKTHYENFNYVLTREHEYVRIGRVQDEDGSKLVHSRVIEMLQANDIPYKEIKACISNVESIINDIQPTKTRTGDC